MFRNYTYPVKTIDLLLLDNKKALEILLTALREYLDESGIDQSKILGVGIGMPGFINDDKGINYSYMQPASGEALRDYLERCLKLPVYVKNDSTMIALAELKFGLARGRNNVMVINIGWGIGLGMIINGELFKGHNGFAGELSHIPITESNILCECGKRGCLETEATLRVVAKKAISEIRKGRVSNLEMTEGPDQMIDFIMDAATQGDQYAIELLTDMAFKIGKAAAILTHIINPELIILSGRGARVGKILIAPMQQALNRYCIPRLAEHMEMKVSQLGHEAGLISAAALVIQHFGDPVLQD